MTDSGQAHGHTMQTIATKITLIRILFIPVFTILLLSDLPYKQWFAASVFAVIAISDGLDGYLARTLNQVTDFGKILDPIADKLVIATALLTLVQVANLPLWAAAVIIGRELIISLFRMVAISRKVIISASGLGKTKTVIQIIAIFCWIFNLNGDIAFINFLSWFSLVLAVLMSVVSGLDYLIKFKSVWNQK